MTASEVFHLESVPTVDIPGATEADVDRIFTDEGTRSEHIVLTRGDGSFLHAAGQGDGPYLLVYHDEPTGRHYRAHAELSRNEAKECMIDLLRNRSAWWDDNDWSEVKHSLPWTLWAGLACLVGAVLCGVLAFTFW